MNSQPSSTISTVILTALIITAKRAFQRGGALGAALGRLDFNISKRDNNYFAIDRRMQRLVVSFFISGWASVGKVPVCW